MQMLWRVDRTGQVVKPAYSQMAAEIPAEARPAAILMKKMASLNAKYHGGSARFHQPVRRQGRRRHSVC
jgi:hypothetical protein